MALFLLLKETRFIGGSKICVKNGALFSARRVPPLQLSAAFPFFTTKNQNPRNLKEPIAHLPFLVSSSSFRQTIQIAAKKKTPPPFQEERRSFSSILKKIEDETPLEKKTSLALKIQKEFQKQNQNRKQRKTWKLFEVLLFYFNFLEFRVVLER